ncbi:Uncharacterised protein [Vibrio cholerae]|nr:hypothetical protein V060002_00003 [Vibrio cholerae]CRZ54473.1 Uncharacterised protein [Vibrio cholerae]CSA58004.1 Uncharacterised protein [Vibrio cholerae]CSD58784.1 Uncharacterised protein [Vibrio cholerae]CSD77869.1 Uncharacterised protein [Vibrio cholerae]
MVVEHAHGLRQRRGPNAKSSLHKAHLAPDAGLQAPGASLSFAQGSHDFESLDRGIGRGELLIRSILPEIPSLVYRSSPNFNCRSSLNRSNKVRFGGKISSLIAREIQTAPPPRLKVGSVEQCWIWGRQSKRRLCDGSNRLGVSGGARSGGSSRCLAAFALAVFCFRCLRICSMTFGSSMLAITLT